MKNGLLCILSLCTLVSCSNTEKKRDIQTISIEDSRVNDMSFLDSIKIIPLETLDTELIKAPQSFQLVNSEKSKFLLFDTNQIIFLFDEHGKFISSSQYCRGEGAKEYRTASDVLFNPYHDYVEIYDPNNGGAIISYDEDFNFKRKIKLNHEKGFTAQIVSLLDSNLYALEPVRLKESDLYLKLYENNENGETKQENINCNKNGYIASLNMMQKVFTQTDSVLYYSPDYMDYHFYQFDVNKKVFMPICLFDMGENTVTKEKLDALYGEASFADLYKNLDVIDRKNAYLMSSDYMLPIIRLINDSYVYMHLISNKKPYDYIYDRKRNEGFLMTPDRPVSFYRCFAMQNNVLYTLLYPYEINKYITEKHKRFITKGTWDKLKYIEEEDNPVVVEYHLKK